MNTRRDLFRSLAGIAAGAVAARHLPKPAYPDVPLEAIESTQYGDIDPSELVLSREETKRLAAEHMRRAPREVEITNCTKPELNGRYTIVNPNPRPLVIRAEVDEVAQTVALIGAGQRAEFHFNGTRWVRVPEPMF